MRHSIPIVTDEYADDKIRNEVFERAEDAIDDSNDMSIMFEVEMATRAARTGSHDSVVGALAAFFDFNV